MVVPGILRRIIPTIGARNLDHKGFVRDQLLRLPKGWRILDAGAGEQYFRQYCAHLDYVSQDFAAYLPDPVERGLQNDRWEYGKLDIICDITAIPEPDASFDAVLCSEVLEHLPYPSDAIRELSRLLKPGGRIILSAPRASLTHQAPWYFCAGFSPWWYERIFGDCGLEVESITANGSWFEFVALENRRMIGVAKSYTTARVNLWEKIVLFFHLLTLDRLSKRDNNSAELVCYGYFVVGRKK